MVHSQIFKHTSYSWFHTGIWWHVYLTDYEFKTVKVFSFKLFIVFLVKYIEILLERAPVLIRELIVFASPWIKAQLSWKVIELKYVIFPLNMWYFLITCKCDQHWMHCREWIDNWKKRYKWVHIKNVINIWYIFPIFQIFLLV